MKLMEEKENGTLVQWGTMIFVGMVIIPVIIF